MAFRGLIGEIVEVRRSDGELGFEWRIPRFLSLHTYGGGNSFHESPRFSFWEGSWFMRVWPNLKLSENVALFLHRFDNFDSTKTVNVTVGVKGSGGVEMKREGDLQISNNSSWGLDEFCRRSKLSERKHTLMPEDALVIWCELRIPGTARDVATETDDDLSETLTDGKKSSGKKGAEELQKCLQKLLAGEDSDVLIKVQGKEFPAHRAILRVRSPVFQAMFAHDMVEKQRGVITMEDCDQETFPDFLEHVYTGSIEMISVSNVFILYRTADKYDFGTLKMECAQFLKDNLTNASFCNSITLAIKHSDKDLIERTTAFFCENSLEIVEMADWQTFLEENPTVGNELFIKALRHERNK